MLDNLINHSPDLTKLRNEGYEVSIDDGYILVSNVPYLNSNKEVKYGTLVSNFDPSEGRARKPENHVISFTGDYPCDYNAKPIEALRHNDSVRKFNDRITVKHSFSCKPQGGYLDFYDKFSNYIEIISSQAKYFNKSITAKTFKIIHSSNDSIFNYPDTNSSRADIADLSNKYKGLKIGIIGLGGTGSYILDHVAKTAVEEIHIFDDKSFHCHNAFRFPGAPSIEQINENIKKVHYLEGIYSKMRKGIKAYPFNITKETISTFLLLNLDFVFIAVDKCEIKEWLFKSLEDNNINFIDVGIGIDKEGSSLNGIVRTTSSQNGFRNHIYENERVSFLDDQDDAYMQNIQISELNSLNACMAVIKWKKMIGYYHDLENENHSTYTIDVNMLLSEDVRE